MKNNTQIKKIGKSINYSERRILFGKFSFFALRIFRKSNVILLKMRVRYSILLEQNLLDTIRNYSKSENRSINNTIEYFCQQGVKTQIPNKKAQM